MIEVKIIGTKKYRDKQRSYIAYIIEIILPPDNTFYCERRYNDFLKLHNQLKKIMSTPEFPSRYTLGNRQDILVNDRSKLFQQYLQIILSNNNIPQLLLLFLGISERDWNYCKEKETKNDEKIYSSYQLSSLRSRHTQIEDVYNALNKSSSTILYGIELSRDVKYQMDHYLFYYFLCICYFLVNGIYVILIPFNKVEESFNIQATHDLLFHKTNLTNYDHLEYSGVVPRTFLGPIVLSIPFNFFLSFLPNIDKIFILISIRILLSFIICRTTIKFLNAITSDNETKILFLLLTISQFHINFYASRTLPNTFAFATYLLAVREWVENSRKKHTKINFKFYFWCVLSCFIFRCELFILLSPIALYDLYFHYLDNGRSICDLTKKLFKLLFFAILIIFVICVLDSAFWKRIIWPELEVFHFNVFLNKSHLWGISPFHYYYTNVLPKLFGLFTPILLMITISSLMEFWSGRKNFHFSPSIYLFFCCINFISLYSILPHKELRFIIYVYPILNFVVCRHVKNYLGRVKWKNLMVLFFLAGLLFNVIFTVISLIASYHNYSGGRAALELRKICENGNNKLSVFIDNYPAQTGMNRFLESNNCIYHKTYDNKQFYDYCLLEISEENKYMCRNCTTLKEFQSFQGISVRNFNLVRIWQSSQNIFNFHNRIRLCGSNS
ncbi:hypothetical protein SNEBB_006599 [Seison nebaliae]|nr:hypothetical protein SNEBB_006599 [Seison nebaliae]